MANGKNQTSRRLPSSFFQGPKRDATTEQGKEEFQDCLECQLEMCTAQEHRSLAPSCWDSYNPVSLDVPPASVESRGYQFEEYSPSPASSFTTEPASYSASYYKQQNTSFSVAQSDPSDDFYGVARSYPSTCAQNSTVERQTGEFESFTDQILDGAPNGEEWHTQPSNQHFDNSMSWSPLPEFSYAFGSFYS